MVRFFGRAAVELRRRRAALGVVLVVCGMAGASVALAAGRTRFVVSNATTREALIAVTLNGHAMDAALPAWIDGAGRVMVQLADLERWRIALPPALAAQRDANRGSAPGESAGILDDEAFVALDHLPGVAYRFDGSQQTLHVTVEADAFEPITLDGQRRRYPPPTTSPPGAILDYDLSVEDIGGETRMGGVFGVAVFGKAGRVFSRFVGQRDDGGSGIVRLETAWRLDQPERLLSWSVGDDVSVAPGWSRAVRFGGVQVRKRFDLQPDLVTYPLPHLQDVAVLPSTVELLVGDALRFHRQVAPGPFTIVDPPLVEGFDHARLIVRDELGRERETTVPFHVEQRLLRRNLSQFAVAAGLLREGFGIDSLAYGPWLATATHRRGLSDVLTVESGVEWTERRRAGGLGVSFLRPGLGIFDATLAVSHHNDRGWGGRVEFGLEHVRKHLSFAVRTRLSDSDYRSLFGGRAAFGATREQTVVRLGFDVGRHALNMSYLRDDPTGQPVTTLALVNGSFRLGSAYHLLASVRTVLDAGLDQESGVGARVSLVRRIGRRATLEMAAEHDHAGVGASVRLQRSADGLTGLRYELEARTRPDENTLQASASWQAQRFGARADLATSGDRLAFRFGLTGSAVTFGDGVAWSRRVSDSFARVELPGMPGVRVYADNRLAGRTDGRGYAVIPNLSGYYPHTIRVEATDLPADVDASAVDTVAVPYRGSGLRVTLPIRRIRSALVTVVSAEGTPLPVGATVRGADGHAVPVGFEGQVYLENVTGTESYVATWPTGVCTFTVSVPEDAGPVPSLGPVPCQELEME